MYADSHDCSCDTPTETKTESVAVDVGPLCCGPTVPQAQMAVAPSVLSQGQTHFDVKNLFGIGS